MQENTDQIWKFQRYRLVFEYYDSPIIPPPFNVISYFISLYSYVRNKKYRKNKPIEESESSDLCDKGTWKEFVFPYLLKKKQKQNFNTFIELIRWRWFVARSREEVRRGADSNEQKSTERVHRVSPQIQLWKVIHIVLDRFGFYFFVKIIFLSCF